jgi:hypothetical protein
VGIAAREQTAAEVELLPLEHPLGFLDVVEGRGEAQIELLQDRRADADVAVPILVHLRLRPIIEAAVRHPGGVGTYVRGTLEAELDASVAGPGRVEVRECREPKPGKAGDHQRRDGRRNQPTFEISPDKRSQSLPDCSCFRVFGLVHEFTCSCESTTKSKVG